MDDAVVLLALLALGLIIAIPVSIAYLFWRQRNLRRQLITLSETHREQHDALQRELAQLKGHLANLSATKQPAPEAPKGVEQHVLSASGPVPDKRGAPPPFEKHSTTSDLGSG